MVSVRDNGGIGEAGLCYILEMVAQVDHKILHAVSVLEVEKVSNQVIFKAIRQDIQHFPVLWVCKYTLVSLAVSISFELVYREHMRQ